MSLVDEVRTVKQRVAQRLAELEPLVREYEELTQLAGELGLAVTSSQDAGAAARPRGRPAQTQGRRSQAVSGRPQAESKRPKTAGRRPPAPARSRAPAQTPSSDGDLGARVLEAVRATPGVSVAQIAKLVGVEAPALYRPVRDLTSEGVLVKRARALFPSEP
jgi:hypothetical protein